MSEQEGTTNNEQPANTAHPLTLQTQTMNSANAIVQTLSKIAFWEGIMRILEMAASITLLGLTGKLTAILNSTSGSAVSLTTANGTYIDISNTTTGANIAGLVTSIITPISHTTLGSWDSLAPKDSSPNVLSTLISASQFLQLSIWLASAIWFTVEYSSWDCSSPVKLLEQYNESSVSTSNTLTNGLGETFFSNNYTSFNYSSLSISDDDTIITGLHDLFGSLGVSQVTLSLLTSDHLTDSQEIISALSKDCSLKKGAIGVSWTGFVFFVISTVLMIIHYRQDSATVSTVAATPLSIKSPPIANPVENNETTIVKFPESLELITSTLNSITIKDNKILSFELRSSLYGYEDNFYISVGLSGTVDQPSFAATTHPITKVNENLTSTFSCNQADVIPEIHTELRYRKLPKNQETQKEEKTPKIKADRWNKGVITGLLYNVYHWISTKVTKYGKRIGSALRTFFVGKKKLEAPGQFDLEFLEYVQYTITASSAIAPDPIPIPSVTVSLNVEGMKTPEKTVQKIRQLQRMQPNRGRDSTAYLASHALLLPKKIK